MTQLISVDPDPVQQGSDAEVCYDFDEGATSPVKLKLQYTNAHDIEITLTKGDNCKKITIPASATGLVIVDDSGQSEDYAVTVTPA